MIKQMSSKLMEKLKSFLTDGLRLHFKDPIPLLYNLEEEINGEPETKTDPKTGKETSELKIKPFSDKLLKYYEVPLVISFIRS